MSLLSPLLTFALALACLVVLSRWIALQVQRIGYRVTGDAQAAVLVYYLLLLPGIFLHELSHYIMAWLLGLRLGKFSLGPKRRRGNAVELGSVTVGSGGALRDSLVGLAPFLGGTAALLLIGYLVFNLAALGRAWTASGWRGIWGAVDGVWRVADFWLWAYLIFAISNAMTPSPADRRPWLTAGLYVALALIFMSLAGLLPAPTAALAVAVSGAVQGLTLAFAFTLALDLLVAAGLWAFDLLLALAGVGGRPRPGQ
jgi:hypothetical protein